MEEELSLALCPGHWDLSTIYAIFPRLRPLWQRYSTTLSGGEQQLLAVARALVRNPGLLLMDEPTEGLAPALVTQVEETIMSLRSRGTTVLLTEQKTDLALRVADRVYLLERGAVVHEGRPDEIEADRERLVKMLGV